MAVSSGLPEQTEFGLQVWLSNMPSQSRKRRRGHHRFARNAAGGRLGGRLFLLLAGHVREHAHELVAPAVKKELAAGGEHARGAAIERLHAEFDGELAIGAASFLERLAYVVAVARNIDAGEEVGQRDRLNRPLQPKQ